VPGKKQPLGFASSDAAFERFLLRGIGELFVRYDRVRDYLLLVAEHGVHEDLTATLRQTLEQAELVTREAIGTALNEPRVRRIELLQDAHEAFATVFTREHERLDLLPAPATPPEMRALIEQAFGQAPRSILLCNIFNAFEYNFDENAGDPKAVLNLAMCDAASPAAWSVLGHEMGHSKEKGEAEQVVRQVLGVRANQKVKAIVGDFASEMFADLVAARALGPAPMIALLSMEYCLFTKRAVVWDPSRLEQGARSHPPTHWRATVVADFLRQYGSAHHLKAFSDEFVGAARRRIEVEHGPDELARDNVLYHRWFERIATVLKPMVSQLPASELRTHQISESLLQRSSTRLSFGFPAAAHGLDKRTLRRKLAAYWRNRKRDARDAFYALADEFREEPSTPAILLLSCQQQRRAVIDALITESRGFADRHEVAVALRRLSVIDQIAQTSIQMMGVHRSVLDAEERPDNRIQPRFEQLRAPSRAQHMPIVGRERGLLSDFDMLSRLVARDERLFFVSPLIDPKNQIGPSSLDLRLGTVLRITRIMRTTHLDLSASDIDRRLGEYFALHKVNAKEPFVIHPGQFALATTLEFLRFPPDIAGRLEGRSTLARIGLQVHATAGFVDPGFTGTLTFELTNAGSLPIQITPGFKLGQVCLFRVDNVQVPYNLKRNRKYGDAPTVEIATLAQESRIVGPRS
jgi:dCTP deaminase